MASKHVKTVLQVTAALESGGVERGTVEMDNYITAQGWHSLVASAGGSMVQHLSLQGENHFALPLDKRNPLTILQNAAKLIRIIQQERPDIVHARSRAPAWAAYLACQKTETPFITTFHGTHGTQNKLKIFYNSAMTRGRHIIAISNFIKKHIMDVYDVPAEKISVVHRGYDKNIFSPDHISPEQITSLKQQYNISPDMKIALIPGRLTHWKGQHVFLEAISCMDNKNVVALVVGGEKKKSGYGNRLRQQASALGIDSRTFFTGQQDLPLYYAAADVVVSASTEPEAFGRVAVEAQAMGKPVIATAHGGALETVKNGETGFLVPPNDAKKLAEYLDKLLTDTANLEKTGNAARIWVKKSFTAEQMCRGEFEVYQKELELL